MRSSCHRAGTVAHVVLGERGARQALCRPGKAGGHQEDNGPEFIAFELTEWLEAQGAATYHIEPGKPWQNSYAESFNNRLQDECLNTVEFWSIDHARVVLESWRIEFNTEHLHSSLGYQTPEEFAASWSVHEEVR
jgi:transposase InsO family protein